MGYPPASIVKNTRLWYATGVIAVTKQCTRVRRREYPGIYPCAMQCPHRDSLSSMTDGGERAEMENSMKSLGDPREASQSPQAQLEKSYHLLQRTR
jgi:hypothetical protein